MLYFLLSGNEAGHNEGDKMKVYPELTKVIRAGAKITREKLESQTYAGVILGIALIFGAMILIITIICKGV